MATVALLCSCVLAGIAAGLGSHELSGAWSHLREAPVRHRSRMELGERFVSLCEQIGHMRALSMASENPAVRAALMRLRPVLASKDMALSLEGCLAWCVFVLSVLSLAGAALGRSYLGALVGAVAFALIVTSMVGRSEARSRTELVGQMPEVLRTLSSALAAGKSLPQAIAHVGSSVSDPIASEFLRASFEIESGRSVDEAVDALSRRIDAPGVELVGTALQVSQRTGSSLSELLSRTSRMVMAGASLRRELMVKTSQARLSARIVSLVPVILVCVLALISPDYRSGLETAGGRACLCISLLLDVVALLWVRSIMRRSLV